MIIEDGDKKYLVDVYGRLAGSVGFHNPREPIPHLFEKLPECYYIAFRPSSAGAQAIHKIDRGNGVRQVWWAWGEWADRAELVYEPINGDGLDHVIGQDGALYPSDDFRVPRWDDIPDKPDKFPPEPHKHEQSDVNGLTDALAGKAPVSHTHKAADISDLSSLKIELTEEQKAALKGEKGEDGAPGKDGTPGTPGEPGAAAGFGTPEVTVTTLESTQTATVEITPKEGSPDTAKVFQFKFGIPKGEKGADGAAGEFTGKVQWSEIEGVPSFANADHDHEKADITDLTEATTSAAGLLSAADKQTIDKLAETYAPKTHEHTVEQVTDLDEKFTALDEKYAAKDHDHTSTDITDWEEKFSALDEKFALANHQHGTDDIEGLLGEDNKIDPELLPDNIAGAAVKPDHLVLIRPRAAKGVFPVVKAYASESDFTNGGKDVCNKTTHTNVKFWNGQKLLEVKETGIPAACEGLPVDIDISELELTSGYFVYSWVDEEDNESDQLILPFPAVVEPTPFATNAVTSPLQPGLKIEVMSALQYGLTVPPDPFTLYFVEGQGMFFNGVKYFAEPQTTVSQEPEV